MIEQKKNIQSINNLIQSKMRESNITSVGPVEATRWLVDGRLREKIESRPGSYLRSLCRAGKITGAKQINKKWWIHKK